MMKATASGQRALTMQFLPIVLYCLLFTAVTTALKRCDDCVKAVDCKPALDLLLSDRSPEAYKQLRDAACDVKGSHKVCCSSILGVRFSTDDIENNAQTTGDEIENHRNIRLLASECGDIDGTRIIGGTTAGLYEFPWMALISYNEGGNLKFKCGGSVITARYVMTAGHCINKSIVGVRIGDYDISQPEDCVGEEELRECESNYQDITVTHRIRHPKYVTESVRVALHDIGLLRLATPVEFSYRNSGTICLPITKVLRESALPDDRGTVAGWGATETQQQSNILLKVQVTIYSELTCKSLYKDAFPSRPYNSNKSMNTICAGETGRDSCKGDSGGPLMVEAPYNGTYKFVQIGIISFGLEGCGTNKPGLYTDVRKYMKWILDTIKP